MDPHTSAVVAAVFLGYSIVAARLSRSMAGPMLFAGVGRLLGLKALDLVGLRLQVASAETVRPVMLTLGLSHEAWSTRSS
jgi:hypothetical protein